MRGPTKTFRLVAALLLGAAVALGGCSAEPASAPPPVRVAFVPKVDGIPYFQAMNTGGLEAAKQLGVQWTSVGPKTVDPAAQVAIMRDLIAKKADVIVVAPNDPAALAPVIAEARARGIHVLTSDTDAPGTQREVFVNQASAEGIGAALTDALMKRTGGAGKYAIVSCGPAAANLNTWIAVQKAYSAAHYPKAQLVETVYAGEDEDNATNLAKELMARHPDLTGLVGECTTSAPGVAKAVGEEQKIGQVFTVGVGTPQAIKPFLLDGSCSESVLWNVESLGYLTAWTAKQVADGKPLQPVNKVSLELPAVKYDAASKTVLLGDPLLITADNVDQFKY
ncbi:autoinducer 2 ABC transporter substrate-binding protein [Amycolatopsis australiensis]|uniref:Monosaccharide ABC transporter substrate-binding protein, CUT2 family n=1 Tax=Amycolatopsis australiensis TaxID=546364 RepID=A0A1K1T600_9PSEU|nr:autoinducer 2 ABC transporter substrate-binding protein [Amycolatopsis australiensis]SFW91964.1 monosaccharide ABC transporter substrate-binding protein, CUT2 family [Amycolatopsis australiensis]